MGEHLLAVNEGPNSKVQKSNEAPLQTDEGKKQHGVWPTGTVATPRPREPQQLYPTERPLPRAGTMVLPANTKP
jgi:hypothetical protein